MKGKARFALFVARDLYRKLRDKEQLAVVKNVVLSGIEFSAENDIFGHKNIPKPLFHMALLGFLSLDLEMNRGDNPTKGK